MFNKFFPNVDTCLSCDDRGRQSCAMVPKWRVFACCISSEPRAAHFRHAFYIRARWGALRAVPGYFSGFRPLNLPAFAQRATGDISSFCDLDEQPYSIVHPASLVARFTKERAGCFFAPGIL